MDIEQRVFALEQKIINLFDRMGKVEDKASGAWKTINEVNRHMEEMDKRIDSLEKDVKEVKLNICKAGKTMKVLVVLVGIVSVISLGFFVYIWRHDVELAKSILTLGATVGKLVV